MNAVERGIAYLNEHEPGWLEKINLEMLDALSPTQCILGQISGRNYRHYLENSPLWDDDAVELGLYIHHSLDANGHIDDNATDRAGAQLTQEWRVAIERVRNQNS